MLPKFRTVAQAIAEVANFYPENDFVFQDMKGDEHRYTFVDLEAHTASRAAALQGLGLEKGDRVGLIVVEPEDFVLSFLACLRVGVVPVPLYPPMSFGALDAYAERTRKVLTDSEAKYLLASGQLQNVLWSLVDQVPSLKDLIKVEALREATGTPTYPEITPEDMAFLQYTSGSTADPKGVVVTHGSLVANSEGIIKSGLQLVPEKDKGVSWLPLYHDMGLIGFVIAPICHAIPIVFIPTMRFIKRPSVWLETIHNHRGTASFGPNFAYALAARRVKKSQLDKWDLSCIKVMGCGAEPIQAETMRTFTKVFHEGCNMPKSAIMPAYGMAEATLAIALKPAPEEFQSVVVDANVFQEEGKAVSPEGDTAERLEHVACGIAFPGHEVCVMNPETDEILGDGVEGELCFKGPSVTPGYFKNPTATAKAFRNGWLHTGDLGFVLDGNVYVTGRIKDLIIVNGRNIHPQAVEWIAAEIDGVRKGNTVAFSRPGATSEELVLVVETRAEDTERVTTEVKQRIQAELSLAVSEVVCLKPGSLPKTSSGKLQRRKTRDQYLKGLLGVDGTRTMGSNGSKAILAKHVAKSLWSRAKAKARSALN